MYFEDNSVISHFGFRLPEVPTKDVEDYLQPFGDDPWRREIGTKFIEMLKTDSSKFMVHVNGFETDGIIPPGTTFEHYGEYPEVDHSFLVHSRGEGDEKEILIIIDSKLYENYLRRYLPFNKLKMFTFVTVDLDLFGSRKFMEYNLTGILREVRKYYVPFQVEVSERLYCYALANFPYLIYDKDNLEFGVMDAKVVHKSEDEFEDPSLIEIMDELMSLISPDGLAKEDIYFPSIDNRHYWVSLENEIVTARNCFVPQITEPLPVNNTKGNLEVENTLCNDNVVPDTRTWIGRQRIQFGDFYFKNRVTFYMYFDENWNLKVNTQYEKKKGMFRIHHKNENVVLDSEYKGKAETSVFWECGEQEFKTQSPSFKQMCEDYKIKVKNTWVTESFSGKSFRRDNGTTIDVEYTPTTFVEDHPVLADKRVSYIDNWGVWENEILYNGWNLDLKNYYYVYPKDIKCEVYDKPTIKIKSSLPVVCPGWRVPTKKDLAEKFLVYPYGNEEQLPSKKRRMEQYDETYMGGTSNKKRRFEEDLNETGVTKYPLFYKLLTNELITDINDWDEVEDCLIQLRDEIEQ